MNPMDRMPSNVVVVYDAANFQYRIHRSTCGAVEDEVQRFIDFGPLLEGLTFQEWAEDLYGSDAADTYEVGSEAWEDDCYEQATSDTVIMPCCELS